MSPDEKWSHMKSKYDWESSLKITAYYNPIVSGPFKTLTESYGYLDAFTYK